MNTSNTKMLKPDKLVIAVTFHFSEKRLPYLKKIALLFPSLSIDLKVFIVTCSPSAPMGLVSGFALERVFGSS